MQRRSPKRHFLLLAAVLATAILAVTVLHPAISPPDRISALGGYQGYSGEEYNRWTKVSRYVAMRDGTRLAVDIYRPTWWWLPARGKLPVVWSMNRYHRADLKDGVLHDPVETSRRYQELLFHGYVLAFADARGSGSSFGTRDGPFSRDEQNDAYDMTEWLAHQPWSSGRVGMFGTSYMGIVQYFAAASAPPSLKAVFPEKAMYDLYDFAYPGGILREDFGRRWSDLVKRLDTVTPSPPVDDDPDLKLYSAARKAHMANRTAYDMLAPLPFRNSVDPDNGEWVYETRNPASFLEEINRSGVAIYQLGGWMDMWPRDALLWYSNLKVPRKIVIGPWSHIGTEDFDNSSEHLRWYDHWLKDVDNGIMSEPPIHYYTVGAPAGKEWRSAWTWPLPEEKRVTFYFCAGDAVNSEGGRGLCRGPDEETAADRFDPDLQSTTGRQTRWSNGYGRTIDYGDLPKLSGISYETPPLDDDMEFTGHPILRLWMASASQDLDMVAYLQEVDAAGRPVYVTEGALRASHRQLAEPPDNRLGLPYHASTSASQSPIPGKPSELDFDLHPISRVFAAGTRLRITLAGADADNLIRHEAGEKHPQISILSGKDYPSSIELPLIPNVQ